MEGLRDEPLMIVGGRAKSREKKGSGIFCTYIFIREKLLRGCVRDFQAWSRENHVHRMSFVSGHFYLTSESVTSGPLQVFYIWSL